jgi:asparagine synthase (glutamine-hydrolysing)
MQSGAIGEAPDPAGHVGFFMLGSVPDPFTLYSAIRSLEAGHTLTLQRGRSPIVERYFAVQDCYVGREAALPPGEARAVLRDALHDSVAHHMVADVPVGVFLSAGMDATTIAAIARETQGSDLRSITLGFSEYKGTARDETIVAAQAAKHIGTRHETHWISRADFDACVEELFQCMDQPSIDGVNTYFVSKAAAASGMKVALSGLGGDEIFGGYPSFRDVPRIQGFFGRLGGFSVAGRLARRIAAPLLSKDTSPKYAGLAEYGGTFPGA